MLHGQKTSKYSHFVDSNVCERSVKMDIVEQDYNM